MTTIFPFLSPKRTRLASYWLSVIFFMNMGELYGADITRKLTIGDEQDYQIFDVTFDVAFLAGDKTYYKIRKNGINPTLKEGKFNDGTNLLQRFKYFDQVMFSLEGDDRVTAHVRNVSQGMKGFLDEPEKTYPGQILGYLRVHPDNLTAAAFAPYKKNSGNERLHGKAPLFGMGNIFGRSGKALRDHSLCRRAPTYYEDSKNNHQDLKGAYVVADILKKMSPQEAGETVVYSDEANKRFLEDLKYDRMIAKLRKRGTIISAIIFLGISLGIYSFFNHTLKFIYDQLNKSWNKPSFIVYSSMPLNLKDRIWIYLFGKPTRLKNTWDKIILHPIIEEQRNNYYNMLKLVLKHNGKLTKKERQNGEGMHLEFMFVSGPPGTGKTMLIEGLAEKAERELKGRVNVITFSGSEASKVPSDQVITAMNEIYDLAEASYIDNKAITLVVMNEGDRFFGDRFDEKVSDARKDITAKFLDMMPEGGHRFLVFIVASNLDVRNEELAKKTMDWAALDRFSYHIIFKKIEDDDEGRAILYQAFMLYLKETAKMIPLKIESSVDPYVKQNIERFTKEYNTPRKMKQFSGRIVKTTAIEVARKKTKRKRLTQDHLMKAFEKEEEKQRRDAESSFTWTTAGG